MPKGEVESNAPEKLVGDAMKSNAEVALMA